MVAYRPRIFFFETEWIVAIRSTNFRKFHGQTTKSNATTENNAETEKIEEQPSPSQTISLQLLEMEADSDKLQKDIYENSRRFK